MCAAIFHKILVADDGSPDGERAASVAVGLAAKLKASVVLLGVVERPNIQAECEGLPIPDPSIARRALEERFERFLQMGDSLGIEIIFEIVEGAPSEQIQKRAKADSADLIVVGRRSLSGVRRWLEGSTSETVLRDTACSVLIAR